MKTRLKIALIIMLLVCKIQLQAQDTVRYIGSTLSNVDYQHGQLSPVIGVHNIQTMRANRADTGPTSWTYKPCIYAGLLEQQLLPGIT
jgi:hypothetical protein